MGMRRTLGLMVFGLALTAASQGVAQTASRDTKPAPVPTSSAASTEAPADEEAFRAAMRAYLASDPEYAENQLKLVKALAGLAVRIERLVIIGAVCQLLSDEDARLIVTNARQDVEAEQTLLLDDQKANFAIYYEGLRSGALVAANPMIPEPAECEAFAKAGGTLVKLLTWTGRPQFISPGIRASPRTLP